jgi:hypothetical protein
MKWDKCRPSLLSAMFAVLFLAAAAASLSQTTKPIAYKGLLNSLKTHGLTNAELTQIVKTRGVDFELTADKESELKAAGADTDLLAAVRANLRGAGAPASPSGGAQTPASPPASTPAAPPPAQPPAEKEKPAAPAKPSAIASIRDVKKLYIEKMPNDLDEYIKAELSRQMPGRVLVVLRVDDADAIMRGTATDRKGSVTITDVRGTADLWVGEAGDKGLYLTKVHGGEKKVAERLVSGLKKAMF